MSKTWKDITSYSRNDKREPRTWEYEGQHLRVVVTRHIYAPDVWHLTCHTMGIELLPLGNISLEEAKAMALKHCLDVATSYVDDLR